jgi:hypothetical protein
LKRYKYAAVSQARIVDVVPRIGSQEGIVRDVVAELAIKASGVRKQVDVLGLNQWRMALEGSGTEERSPCAAVVGRYSGPLPKRDEEDG